MAENDAEEKRREYLALCHAMPSGVALDQERGATDGTPKHLRVGLNAAMSDHGALVGLLIDKGRLLTEVEYYDYLIEYMKREVERYEKKFGVRFG